MMIEQI